MIIHSVFQYGSKILLGLALFALAGPLQAEAEPDQAIQAPVIELHDTLLKVMENAGAASFQERYAWMETTINNNFNTALIVRVILSRVRGLIWHRCR